jgi:uncharacterized membrane protein YgcG
MLSLSVLVLFLAVGPKTVDLPTPSTEAITDYAKVLIDADREKVFSGLSLRVMGAPTMRIVIFPSLEGQDPDTFARRLADAWGFPTDFGYLLVVFAKEGRCALVVNLSAAKNGFGPEEWRAVKDEVEPDLSRGLWGVGLNRAVVRIMWEGEAARAQAQGSGSGVLFAHTMGRRPILLVPVVVVVLAAAWWFSSSRRLRYLRRR